MTKQLFADKINTLNQEIAALQQELASRQEAIATIEKLEEIAGNICNELSGLVPGLDRDSRSTLKESILEIFDTEPTPDPNLDPDSNSNNDSTQEKTSSEVEKENNDVKQQSVNNNDKISQSIESSQPQESLPTSVPSTIDRETKEDKYILDAHQLTPNIFKTNQNGLIIGHSNKTKLETWGKYFVEELGLCKSFEIISGARCITPHKHELHLLQVNESKINELIDLKIDFKKTPNEFFNKEAAITPPPVTQHSLVKPILPDELVRGDLVQTLRGEYEVIEVIPNNNSSSLHNNDRPEFLVKSICLKHSSNSELIGQTVNVPLEHLTSATKKEVPPQNQIRTYQVGDLVEIISERKGKELKGQVGKVSFSNTEGCGVRINNRDVEYFFPEEVAPATTTDHQTAA